MLSLALQLLWSPCTSQGSHFKVMHEDIKFSNIVLDKIWNAKLGDFGLARLVDHWKEATSNVVAGRYGCISHEVAAVGCI
jgi:serine/threonine protein kinase